MNNTIVSCSYNINAGANIIEIPDTLDGQAIYHIGDNAFQVAGKIAELILPSTLQTIGSNAFESHALTSLDIPDGVTSIGYAAFAGNALSSITLPDGLEWIGGRAFEDNQLKAITLPNGLEWIGWSAFRNNQIESLTIPNSVTSIESSAFERNKISVLNFQAGCQLKEISHWCFSDNNIKNLVLPNSIVNIEEYAFHNNQNLTKVTFGPNLMRIKRGAFYRCNLSSLSFPGSLVFIGKHVFGENYNLDGFNLPVSSNNYQWNDSNGNKHNEGDHVTDLGSSYVAIVPYTLTANDVHVDNGNITYCSFFDDITNFASVITIPDQINGQEITRIEGGVFNNKGISEVILPQGIKEIGHSAFANNEIIHLTIPNSLEKVEDWAFYDNCINTITFEETSQLEWIGIYSFHANRLTKLDIPASVKKIGKNAFEWNWLQQVNFEENSQLLSIGSRAFNGNGEMLNITLPDPSSNIYNNYWVDWDEKTYTSGNLTVNNFETFYKIPIEYTLTDDDVEVVDGVIVRYTPTNPYANLLTIPNFLDGQVITGIGNDVFARLGLIGINLPSTLEIIQYSAFSENDILNLTIPENVENIQGGAFHRNNINELIFEENSSLTSIGDWSFSENKISSLVLPENISRIEWGAFAYNFISSGLVIPDSVEYIGWYAFHYNQIPQLTFGENSTLSYLGEYAFEGNQISNELFIPLTLTEISDYAFRSNNISKVITHENVVEYGNGAFDYNDPSLTIVLHEPPTIPLVTYFFWWKDNFGNHYDPGDVITYSADVSNFSNRYKAVIDQFFVVKFIVSDDNGQLIENASIDFFYKTLTTDENGVDSIGPVLRGIQEYTVSGVEGCWDFTGTVDVQDNMTVLVTLTRYYNVDIHVIDIDNNPISGAEIFINDQDLVSSSSGVASIELSDGNYPYSVTVPGYKKINTSLNVLNSDMSDTIVLSPVLATYYPNEGEGDAFTETTYGSSYSISENQFSRTAYTFSHWNTDPDDSGAAYVENETIALGYTDFDLYAIWEPVDYNIIYHLDGGTNDPGNPSVYNIESAINFLPASKTSLYFATWIDADSNRVDRIEYGTTGDIELWAIYTPEPTYFIDYHNLENASHTNPATYTKFDLPVGFSDAVKIGYQFLGWYEDSLLTKPITAIPTGSAKNYDIYARWGNAMDYAISYSLGGGTNSPLNPATYTIESEDIIFESPSKNGANFTGWYSDTDLVNPITMLPNGSTGDTALYAGWELDTFEINYVLNGGTNHPSNPVSFTIDSEPIIFNAPTRTGATFVAWYSDENLEDPITGLPNGSYGDTTLYAKWELDSYNIDYVLNGGTNDPLNPSDYNIESEDIVFAAPSKAGANFTGWYIDESFGEEITGIPEGTMGDTIVYARWELDTFNIQYELDGGINDTLNPAEYTVESGTIVFKDPYQDGLVFDGWYSDPGFLEQIGSIPEGSMGDTVIYAKWIELYTVNFIITTDGVHPAGNIDIVIDDTNTMISDDSGLADTVVVNGSSFNYSIEIDSIVIDYGSVSVSGSDVTVKVEIVDCYMRWDDVIFCDNGSGLWTGFAWYLGSTEISGEQFFHNPEGIEDGSYQLKVTSVDGIQYTWEKDFVNGNFAGNVYKSNKSEDDDGKSGSYEVKIYPCPVQQLQELTLELPDDIELRNTHILIYDVRGALVMKIKEPFYINEIFIDNRFSAGLYNVLIFDYKEKSGTAMKIIVD